MPSKVPVGGNTPHCRLVGCVLSSAVADIVSRYIYRHPRLAYHSQAFSVFLHGGIEEARETDRFSTKSLKIDSRVRNHQSSLPLR